MTGTTSKIFSGAEAAEAAEAAVPGRRSRPLALSAVLAASVALVTACGSSATSKPVAVPSVTRTPATSAPSTTPTPTPPAPTFSDKVPTISDGTPTVMINHRAVTFPSNVTDAVWSPNGTRLAYVDSNGNIAVAYADGSHVQILTKSVAGVERAHPTWVSTDISFAEQGADGKLRLKTVTAPIDGVWHDPAAVDGEIDWQWSYRDGAAPTGDATSPSAMADNPPASRSYGGLEYAAQHQTASGPEVVIFDRNLRGGMPSRTVKGSDPAVSPDGTKVAYVGANGQISIVESGYLATPTGPAADPVQITFGVSHPSHPAWSADGSRIAFSTSADVESVSATVASGTTANAVTQESAKPGTPTYQNLSRPLTVTQFDGSDPVAMSVALSQQTPTPVMADFNPTQGHAGTQAVLVATGSDVEAEAAAAFATTSHAGLYFTKPGSLDPRVAAEWERLFGLCAHSPDKNSFCGANHVITVTIVGSTSDIPASVDAGLTAQGYSVRRVSAADPYGLSIVGAAAQHPSTIVVAAADDHASALAAAHSGAVLVLTNGSSMPDAVKPFLDTVDTTNKGTDGAVTKVYAVGSEAAAALASNWTGKPKLTVTPLVGADSAASAVLAAETLSQGRQVISSLVLMPPSTGRADVAVFALPGTALPVDPSGGLSADESALLGKDAISLDTASIVGDVTPYVDPIAKALDGPVAPVVTTK